MVTKMTLDADSDLARKVRNLTLSEDRLDQDYELYSDLLPDHLQRERKVSDSECSLIIDPERQIT